MVITPLCRLAAIWDHQASHIGGAHFCGVWVQNSAEWGLPVFFIAQRGNNGRTMHRLLMEVALKQTVFFLLSLCVCSAFASPSVAAQECSGQSWEDQMFGFPPHLPALPPVPHPRPLEGCHFDDAPQTSLCTAHSQMFVNQGIERWLGRRW